MVWRVDGISGAKVKDKRAEPVKMRYLAHEMKPEDNGHNVSNSA